MQQFPRISKPTLQFSDEAKKLVEMVLQRPLADVIAPRFPIGFTFPDAGFIALRAAPLKTYTPRFELADDIKKQVGDLTAVGIVEVGQDPDYPDAPAVIAAGPYVVAIDLPQGKPQEGAIARGALIGEQIYPAEFTVDAQVRNREAPPGQPPRLDVSIPSDTICYYAGLGDTGVRYVASGPQPWLSVADNYPERFEMVREQMLELAQVAGVEILSDQTIAEMEDPARIEACASGDADCGADIVLAPVAGFPARPVEGTVGVLQVLNEIALQDGTVIAPDQYLLRFARGDSGFTVIVLAPLANPSLAQPVPTVGAWYIVAQGDDPIRAQVGACKILDSLGCG